MNEIYILYILFSILFLIERKAINILMNYIGITIIIAILISMQEPIKIIEGEYISYILILVQVSALTILFGFIIMLYPDYSTRGIVKTSFNLQISKILFIIFLLLLFFWLFQDIISSFNISEIFVKDPISLRETLSRVENYNNNTIILRKIGELLFLENNNILKLIIITIILLLAIIALFFLIL